MEVYCNNCGKSFTRAPSSLRQVKHYSTCSVECMNEFKDKVSGRAGRWVTVKT